jgi:hypothetical protein
VDGAAAAHLCGDGPAAAGAAVFDDVAVSLRARHSYNPDSSRFPRFRTILHDSARFGTISPRNRTIPVRFSTIRIRKRAISVRN